MDQPEPQDISPAQAVLRLALVMNGGVSLAVWMGGVTHEIDRLLNRSGTVSPGWRAILDARSRARGESEPCRVVVDYVAGTSAGGLNGTLLATALARGATHPALARLWRSSAQLTGDALLPDLGDADQAVLDGKFFGGQIADQLGSIKRSPNLEPEDVTLLVTATALDGGAMHARDVCGRPPNATDHRRVYRFDSPGRTHLGHPDDQFHDTTTLALAGRASASFPVAFVPARESEKLLARNTGVAAGGTTTSWLIDGGVLDNAPFEPLMRELRSNPRPDPGERWVVYVVPSAVGEGPGGEHADVPVDPAPSWRQVVGQLGSLKGEVDLRADVEALERLQQEARASQQRPEVLIGQPPLLSPQDLLPLFELYRRSRTKGFLQHVRERVAGQTVFEVVALDPAVVEDWVTADPYFLPPSLDAVDEHWRWGIAVVRRMTLWISRYARANAASSGVLAALYGVERELQGLGARVEDVLSAALGDAEQLVPEALRARSDDLDAITREAGGLMRTAVAAWAGSVPGLELAEAWQRLATVEVVANVQRWQDKADFPEFDLVLVDPAGHERAPALFGAGLGASLGGRPNAKLFGTRLMHFGAFGHVDFRDHDWLWGRIDGALCLADALLPTDVGPKQRGSLLEGLLEEVLRDAALEREAVDPIEGQTHLQQVVERTIGMAGLQDRDLVEQAREKGEVEIVRLLATVSTALGAAALSVPWHRARLLMERVRGWLRELGEHDAA